MLPDPDRPASRREMHPIDASYGSRLTQSIRKDYDLYGLRVTRVVDR